MFMGEKDRETWWGGGCSAESGRDRHSLSLDSLGHHIEYFGLNGKVWMRCNQGTNIYSQRSLWDCPPERKDAVCNEGHSKKRGRDLELKVIG